MNFVPMWATVDVLGLSSHALHNRGEGEFFFYLFEEAHDSCCLEAKTWKHLETTWPFVCSRTAVKCRRSKVKACGIASL